MYVMPSQIDLIFIGLFLVGVPFLASIAISSGVVLLWAGGARAPPIFGSDYSKSRVWAPPIFETKRFQNYFGSLPPPPYQKHDYTPAEIPLMFLPSSLF